MGRGNNDQKITKAYLPAVQKNPGAHCPEHVLMVRPDLMPYWPGGQSRRTPLRQYVPGSQSFCEDRVYPLRNVDADKRWVEIEDRGTVVRPGTRSVPVWAAESMAEDDAERSLFCPLSSLSRSRRLCRWSGWSWSPAL